MVPGCAQCAMSSTNTAWDSDCNCGNPNYPNMPIEWKEPAVKDGNQPLCISEPAAREWYLKSFQTLLQVAPSVDMIMVGAFDNRADICDSRCPRCASRSIADRFSELYKDIVARGVEVRRDFELVLYDWSWPDSFFNAVPGRLPAPSRIVTRLHEGAVYTPNAAHPEWSGRVSDQSLACNRWDLCLQRPKRLLMGTVPCYVQCCHFQGCSRAGNCPMFLLSVELQEVCGILD